MYYNGSITQTKERTKMDPMIPDSPDFPQTESVWSKKQTDMTGADELKIGVALIVVTAVTPFVVQGVVAGVKGIRNALRTRKANKEQSEETPETPDPPKATPKGK
jgi:hypothetical protein